jgi:hypothetical protein
VNALLVMVSVIQQEQKGMGEFIHKGTSYKLALSAWRQKYLRCDNASERRRHGHCDHLVVLINSA